MNTVVLYSGGKTCQGVTAYPPGRACRRHQATDHRSRRSLFEDPGYPSATIDAIAAGADVAVETVYARFGNKAGVLKAVLDQAIIGTDRGPALLEQPAMTEMQHSADQAEQLRLLARFSTGILTRAIKTHRILETAAAIDRSAAELLAKTSPTDYRPSRPTSSCCWSTGHCETG